MADYTITINASDYFGGGSSGSSGGASFGSASSGGGTSDTSALADIYGAYKAIKGFAPVAATAGITGSIFQWQISLVGRNTGNSLVQDKINYGMQLAGQIGSSVGIFGLGAALGSPLMMIAGVTSGISTLINYAKQREQFNYERTWESRELVYARERAGMSYNRSRTE